MSSAEETEESDVQGADSLQCCGWEQGRLMRVLSPHKSSCRVVLIRAPQTSLNQQLRERERHWSLFDAWKGRDEALNPL